MRINVYSQELTEDIELVEKKGTNEEGAEEVFYGIRFFLHSSPFLHNTDADDDRSAVTFWLPKNSIRRQGFANTLYAMGEAVESTIKLCSG